MTCKNKNCEIYLDCLNDAKKYYKFNILKNLAPLLIADKPIHLFCFRNDFKFKDEILKKLNTHFSKLDKIKYTIIPCTNNTVKILFYNIDNIKKILNNPKKQVFLKSIGHKEFDDYSYYIKYFIKHLQKNDFPPEIGIFFGYPVKDVIGYIGHPSLKKTEVNCWTFYGDPRLSREIANKYLNAQKNFLNYFLEDNISINQLINNLNTK